MPNKLVDIDTIETKHPFNSIFDIEDKVVSAIKESMEISGYDQAFPIIVWNNVVVDGHTRLIAATSAGFTKVPVIYHEFENESEALEYAIHNQRNRRNLTPGELLRCIEALDRRKERGGLKNPEGYNQYKSGQFLEPKNEQTEPSHKKTAETLGVGQSTVSNARTILDSDDEEIRNKVDSGEVSIDKAAKEIREEKKQKKEAEKPTFNQTNENIDWAKWSWNPVTGCKHECEYCYARDIANRFYPHGFEPHFYPKRLNAPGDTKIPENRKEESGIRNVFVCSMGDLLGAWVEKDWINEVIESMSKHKEWNYILLTKNPKRYLEFEWPKNCWLGSTADTQQRMNNTIDVFKQIDHPVRFTSCEPLMEKIVLPENPSLDWVIVGGRSRSSRMAEGQPEWDWVKSLIVQCNEFNIPLYMKPNLTIKSKEYPKNI